MNSATSQPSAYSQRRAFSKYQSSRQIGLANGEFGAISDTALAKRLGGGVETKGAHGGVRKISVDAVRAKLVMRFEPLNELR